MTCTIPGCGFDHFHNSNSPEYSARKAKPLSDVTAGELNALDIGKTITIQIGDDATITDKLTAVHHDADIIEDSKITGETDYAVGRIHTTATFIRCGEITLNPNQKVTVQ